MLGITVSALRKSFGLFSAVDGIDLEVSPGTLVSLLGPSGCGKTTTLRMLAGLERPDSGEIRVGDRVLNAPGTFVPPEHRRAGMVFQSYAIWPHMTVAQNVAFPLIMAKTPSHLIKQRVAEVLSLVGLSEYAKRPSPQLSGGQQQRVALARALVGQPDYLLLDEPLSNLDARLREQVRGEIRRMQQSLGITSVFVTHDQLEALTLSDRVVVMNRGRVEQVGTPHEVYEHPASRYVMDFLGHVNYLRAELVQSGASRCAVVGGAKLELPADTQISGKTCLVAVRPSGVRIVPESNADWQGTIEVATYQGSETEFEIRVGADLLRVVDASLVDLKPGSEVGLALDRSKILFWPDESSDAGHAK